MYTYACPMLLGFKRRWLNRKILLYWYLVFEDLIWKAGLDMGLAARKQNRLQVEVKLGTNSVIVGVWALYLTEDTQLESWMTACLANGGGISCFTLEVALGTSQGFSLWDAWILWLWRSSYRYLPALICDCMSYSLLSHTFLDVLLKPHYSLRNNAETKEGYFIFLFLFCLRKKGNKRRIRKYLLKGLIF